MRCTIANVSFYLTVGEVQRAVEGVTPEPGSGPAVRIGRRWYPLMQVGELLTRQDRRDFNAEEVRRAMVKLGLTCRAAAPAAPAEPTAL